MSNSVSQPSAAQLFAEEKIPDTYDRTKMQQALTRYAATELTQPPKAVGEGALFQRSLERIIPSGEVQLNLASHDCIIHKQAVQDVLVHQGRRRTCVVSQVVQTDHVQSQSVNIVGDLPNNFKVQIGSQDRLYITASSLTKDRVIQFEKTAGSSARMAVIIGDRSVSSATFKDGVGKFEFADGGSLTVKGLQEPSDLIVTDNKATAAAGQFKDIGLFAEKMAQLSLPAPALALAPTPQMKDEKSKDPIAQKEGPLAKRLQEMEQKTAALEKKVAEQTELLEKAEATNTELNNTNIELNKKLTASTEATTKAQQAATTAEAGKEAVQSELTSAKTTVETLSTQVTQTKDALAKSNTALTAAEAKSTTSQGTVAKLQKQVDEAALDVKNKDTEIQKLTAGNNKLTADNKIAEATKLEAQQDLAKVEKAAQGFKSQASGELAAANKELDTAKINNTTISNQLKLANNELTGNQTKLAEAATRAKTAEAALKSANEKLLGASKEKEAAKLKTEKAESQVTDLTKARDEAKTNEQSAKLETDRVRKELADINKTHLEELTTEKTKTKEESTKAKSAAATAKGDHETLTNQLNTAQGELAEALTKLKETPPVGQPKLERLSAILTDVDTDTKDKDAKIERFISDVADSAIKKLLQELFEKNQENKYLQDAVKFLALSNSPKIMAQVQQILVGDLTPAEQKEYLAHLTYGPGGVEGYNSYSAYFHQLGPRQTLLMDIIDNEPGMSKEGKEKAKKLYDDMSTEYARKCLKEFNDAAAAKKKAAESK